MAGGLDSIILVLSTEFIVLGWIDRSIYLFDGGALFGENTLRVMWIEARKNFISFLGEKEFPRTNICAAMIRD